jgi:hypothetical protein
MVTTVGPATGTVTGFGDTENAHGDALCVTEYDCTPTVIEPDLG